MLVDPLLVVLRLDFLLVEIDTLKQFINTFEVFDTSLLILGVSSTELAVLLISHALDHAGRFAVKGHVRLEVLPQQKIERALPHSLLRVKDIYDGACERPLLFKPRQVINGQRHVCVWSQVADADWELDQLIELVSLQ